MNTAKGSLASEPGQLTRRRRKDPRVIAGVVAVMLFMLYIIREISKQPDGTAAPPGVAGRLEALGGSQVASIKRRDLTWWQGGLAAVGVLLGGGATATFATYCSSALAASIVSLALAPIAAPATYGGCLAAGGLMLAGTFISGATLAAGWNFSGGSNTVSRDLYSDTGYTLGQISAFEAWHADQGYYFNDTHTAHYYNDLVGHQQEWDVLGRFVMSKPSAYAGLRNATWSHLVYTNHTGRSSVAIASDESINEVLTAPMQKTFEVDCVDCGGLPPPTQGVATWLSFNLYGYNGNEQWDGHGIIDAGQQCGTSGSGLGNYLNDNDVAHAGKFCTAASLEGDGPGQYSIVVGETYVNAYGGIDGTCDSF